MRTLIHMSTFMLLFLGVMARNEVPSGPNQVLQLMNFTFNPCSNFYGYACGNMTAADQFEVIQDRTRVS